MQYIIQDWAGNRLHPNKVFDDIDDASIFVDSNYTEDERQDIYIVPAK